MVLMFVASPSFSQNDWPPVGAYWNYQGDFATHNGYPVDAEKTIYILRDTMINGEIRKIYRDVGYASIDYYDSLLNVDEKWDIEGCCYYMRNDTFFLDDFFGNTLDLFVMNLSIGDSSVQYQQGRWFVDSLGSEVIGSDTFEITYYKVDCGLDTLPGITIDRVGPLGIEPTSHPDGICNIGGFTPFEWHFQCYEGDGLEYPNNCEPLQTGIEKHIASTLTLSLYPNPANDFLHIEFSETQDFNYSIYSIQGECVKKGELKDQSNIIDLSDLVSGMYSVQVVTDSGRKVQRKFFVQ